MYNSSLQLREIQRGGKELGFFLLFFESSADLEGMQGSTWSRNPAAEWIHDDSLSSVIFCPKHIQTHTHSDRLGGGDGRGQSEKRGVESDEHMRRKHVMIG